MSPYVLGMVHEDKHDVPSRNDPVGHDVHTPRDVHVKHGGLQLIKFINKNKYFLQILVGSLSAL